MTYNLDRLPLQTLLSPLSRAEAAIIRLDERLANSPVGEGFLQRSHFSDACASLWVDGDLAHLEDLVLHDAGHDIRAPSHELTIAREVLRTRRRIASHPPDWALTPAGLRTLKGGEGRAEDPSLETKGLSEAPREFVEAREEPDDLQDDPLAKELAAMDALLARSETVMAAARQHGRRYDEEKASLVYDPEWDEEQRMDEWLAVVNGVEDYPPVLQAILLLDAWNEIGVLQHAPWLGRLLFGACLRQCGVTTGSHLTTFNLGLKAVAVERRRHRQRDVRLMAMLQGLILTGEQGLKDHDRLLLARELMERRLVGRRTTSRLPELVDLVMARPLVSTGMVAETLNVTPRAALRIVEELGLRELTGRGRYRAWGVL
ncbi:RHE_PE00001 family protein [Affinirhizobium pseudoryzae]|jgi:hypothetical protein|uniref:RHE_PE00001 family protein n=1 Tax=Allorhizobium pseudoryzae TaxID=379684 RepID=UPI0013EC889A|nr:RHE_PE00001 family protein [Allorhizobium pseudoryzae]